MGLVDYTCNRLKSTDSRPNGFRIGLFQTKETHRRKAIKKDSEIAFHSSFDSVLNGKAHRIGQIIGGHVDGLHRGNGATLGRGNALLRWSRKNEKTENKTQDHNNTDSTLIHPVLTIAAKIRHTHANAVHRVTRSNPPAAGRDRWRAWAGSRQPRECGPTKPTLPSRPETPPTKKIKRGRMKALRK